MTGWNISVPTAEYYDHKDSERLASLIAEVSDQKEIAIDTETTGLVSWRDVPLYWSLAWGDKRVTLNVSILHYFSEVFKDSYKKWIFANAKYDAHILANVGVSIAGQLVDVQVMHALLYEERSHSLKDIADHILGWRWKDFQDTFGKISEKKGVTAESVIRKAERENFSLLVEYAANDAWGTLSAFRELKKQLEEAQTYSLYNKLPPYIINLWDLFSKVEVPYTKVLWKTERHGIKVNLPYLEKTAPIVKRKIEQLEKDISKAAGTFINPNSPDQLQRLLFDTLGLKPIKHTKGGKSGVRKPSTDASVLEYYADEVPLAKMLLNHRELSKFYGTYVTGLHEVADPNGRIHTHFNQDVARTGRLSSSGPNMQNIPTVENDEWKIRGAFIAEPGNVLIAADYCISPETRILTSDLRWIPAIDIPVGETLIGFDEELSRDTKYRRSKVIAKKVLTKPCYCVTMSNGVVLISSHDHSWAVGGGGHSWKRRNRSWVRTDKLEVGDQISHFCEPWDVATTRDAGYLAGVLDGEGWVAKAGKVGFAQLPNACLQESERILKGLPLQYARRSRDADAVQSLEFYGDKGGLRALGILRPIRLLEKSEYLWLGKRTWSSATEKILVTKIEYVGQRSVVALQTSSKTFIAEGFLSHNCQLEMRLLAAAAGEKDMIEVFDKNWDIHMGNASLMFGIPYEEISRATKVNKRVKAGELSPEDLTPRMMECLQARKAAKAIGFGLNYGMGAKKLANQLGCTVGEAKAKIDQYKATYPAVAQFYDEAIEETGETGFSFTLLGRRRNVPEILSPNPEERNRGERIAVNTQIQGSAADVVKMAQILCDKAGLEEKYSCLQLLQIHDELVFECPAEVAVEAKAEIKDFMEHPFITDLLVALTVDIGHGNSWMEAK